MDAVDEYFPDPVRQLDKPFLMPIEDVFSIQVRQLAFVLSGVQFHGFASLLVLQLIFFS